jgi:MYXO-CTERM domain-containing protein
MRCTIALTALTGGALSLASVDASAQLTQRFQVASKGGVATIGSSLGHDCGSSQPAPSGSNVSCIGVISPNDSSPDIYYVDNTAHTLTTATEARTSATLALPSGATVIYARLYWSAVVSGANATADTTVAIGSPQTLATNVVADATWTVTIGTNTAYHSTGDVTALVAAVGAAEYRVTEVSSFPTLASLNEDLAWSGWSLVVFYDAPSAVFVDRALYDGFEDIQNGTSSTSLPIVVPNTPSHPARLTLIAYDGDFDITGESVTWNTTPLFDILNPANNFFNGSRTRFGLALSGTVPALSGLPDSVSGLDIDTIDLTPLVSPGPSTATLDVATTGDRVFVGAAVVEFDGCGGATECTGVNEPACNTATGNCQLCVPNVDAGACVTSPEGTLCIDDGVGGVFCGCNGDSDCLTVAPFCDTTGNTCVECILDSHCEAGEICDPSTHECITDPGTGGGGMSGSGGSGGMNGSGGAGGGMSGSGGAGATGGMSGSGGAGGDMSGSGAGMSGTGASTGGQDAGSGGAGAAAGDVNGLVMQGGGCGCGLAGTPHSSRMLFLLAAAAAAVARRRRRS